MLDHIIENISRFGALNVLDAFLFGHFNFTIRTFIREMSMRWDSTLDEALKLINSSVSNDELGITMKGRKKQRKSFKTVLQYSGGHWDVYFLT